MSLHTAAYRQAMIAAYMVPVGWSKASSMGDSAFVQECSPRIDLGPNTGKTQATIEFAQSREGVVIVTATRDQADRILRKDPSLRVESLDYFAKRSKPPLDSDFIIFDDTEFVASQYQYQGPSRATTTAILKHKPTKFIRVGRSG